MRNPQGPPDSSPRLKETRVSETPAALLRRAADYLDKLAEKATPNVCPDWTYHAVRHIARNCDIECYHEVGHDDAGANHDGWDRYEDAPWIAAMGPQVAPHLSLWLRAEADDLHEEQEEATGDCQDCSGTGEVYDGDPLPFNCSCRRVGADRPSVALAAAVLGETGETA